ncbi:MAG: N-formylglutamate amidohydrolase [Gemmatimonadaceae bacterium]
MTAPFTIARPSRDTPLLYDSPHSGRLYPADFTLGAPLLDVRRGEDAYVDELLADSPAEGATLLTATYPRCYIDVNRDARDIDAALLAEPWPEPLAPSEKTARGLGLIRRFVVPGVEAQGRLLTVRDVRARIDDAYRPYHAALDTLVHELHERFGAVWHVDWHSMKSVGNTMTPDGEGASRADFVVSDRRGASAAPRVTGLVADTLRAFGYSVSVNDPYTGGTIVQRVGRPADGVHSVQIEINRRLYLDELAVEKTAGFPALAERLTALTRALAVEAMRS